MDKRKFVLTRRQTLNYIFYFAYFLQVILTYVLGYTTLVYKENITIALLRASIKYFSLLLVIGLIIYKIYINRYKHNLLYIVFFSLFIVLISAIKSNNYNIFYAMIFGIAAVDINYNEFFKFDIIFKIICIAYVYILCQLRVIDNYYYFKQGHIIQSLGFTHPNFLGIIIAFLVMEYICYKNNILKFRNYIFILFVSYLIYNITGSITGSLMVIFSLILSIIINNALMIKKVIIFLTKYMYAICTGLFFIFAMHYNLFAEFISNNLGSNMLSRLIYANIAMQNYGLKIFGQKITLISNEAAQKSNMSAFVLDSSYIRLGVIYGILAIVIMGLFYYKLSKYCIRNKFLGIIIAIIVILICGISESHMLIFQINFLLILFGNLLKRREI